MGIRFTKKKGGKSIQVSDYLPVIGGLTSRIVSTLKSIHFGHPAGRNAMVELVWKKMLKRSQLTAFEKRPSILLHLIPLLINKYETQINTDDTIAMILGEDTE